MTPRILYSQAAVRGWLPWGLLVPLLALAFVALPLIPSAIGLQRGGLMNERGPVGVAGAMALLLSAFPLTALLTWAWLRWVERRPLDTIGLVKPRAARRFWAGHLIGVGSVVLAVSVIALLGGYRAHGVLPAFSSPAALGGALLLLFGFAVQSSVEEILFRGWMLSGIARKLNVPIAVLLTSLLFGLLHHSPHNLLAFAGAFMFSVLTCAWALGVGHVWGVMGWHSGWNWLLAAGFELPLSGTNPIEPALLTRLIDQGPRLLSGGAYGPEASLATITILIAASAALLWQRRTPKQPGASTPA
ncbi:MAG: CPBP family intramembrane metalloprotease [Burkholderiaceae bacterium]|nr:CPBP family intramembrane metalloprotease [Burkholderiaceae bacterium]